MFAISIGSQKGGVGKSPWNYGVACAIKEMNPEARVLFIDATEQQATLSGSVAPAAELAGLGLGKVMNLAFSGVMRGERIQDNMGDFTDGLERAVTCLKECVVAVNVVPQQTSGYIDVLPAARGRLGAVIETKWHEDQRGYVFGALLARISDDYDYCVIDVDPNLRSPMVQSVMRTVDALISVQDASLRAKISGLGDYIAAAKMHEAPLLGVVLTRYTGSAGSKKAVKILRDLCAIAGLPVLAETNEWATFGNSMEQYRLADGSLSAGIFVDLFMNPSQRVSIERVAKHFKDLAQQVFAYEHKEAKNA